MKLLRVESVFGQLGEKLAYDYLIRKGYTVLERNWRSRNGEIDIISQKDDIMVFVEVKTRRNEDFATVVEQITPDQCLRVRRSAQFYLLSHRLDEHVTPMRFDVIAICQQPEQLYWLPDAF